MPDERTVKARAHHGARSLDLTVPTDLCSTHGIRAGDVFSVEVERAGGRLVVRYTRVYPD